MALRAVRRARVWKRAWRGCEGARSSDPECRSYPCMRRLVTRGGVHRVRGIRILFRMSTLVIAVNLGHLKAFRVVETPTRGRKLDLIDEMEFPEAHGHYVDKVTDMAGPGSAMSTGEALTAGLDIQRRLIKLIAERITVVLNGERPEYWHFAANPEVHQAILNELAPELSERVVRHVQADLTKVPVPEVLAHFMPMKAA